MTVVTKLKPTQGITTDIPGTRWEVAEISPSAAAAMLDRNLVNRKMRTGTLVKKYAADMAAGKWRLTFDPIRFDDKGELLDGQHRLAACVEAGVPFTSLVIYGLPTETRDFIDIGMSRKLSDALAMQGYQSTSHMVAMLRWIHAIKIGAERPDGARVTNAELTAFLERHPALIASSTVFHRVVKRTTSPALVGVIHYLATHKLGLGDRAEAFVEVIQTGLPDYTDDPAHKLREFIIETRGTRARLTTLEFWRSTVHVWNLFAARRPMKQLKWPKSVDIAGLDRETL